MLRFPYHYLISPFSFRFVQRLIASFQEIIDRTLVSFEFRDAKAGGHGKAPAVGLEMKLSNSGPQSLSKVMCSFQCGFRKEETEFFAAISSAKVHQTCLLHTNRRYPYKNPIALSMSVTIVYLLEVVDVHHYGRELQIVTQSALDLYLSGDVELPSIVETREWVNSRESLHLLK